MAPPLARTNAEAHLYMDLQPCPTCGEHGFDGASSVVVVDDVYCSQYTGRCRTCHTGRTFTFRLPDEIRPPHTEQISFGGPKPSELLDPGEWLEVADLAATAAPQPDASQLSLAASALDEVLKFIPDGADEVPREAFRSYRGRELYATEPGRFRRRRLVAVATLYRDLAVNAPPPGDPGDR